MKSFISQDQEISKTQQKIFQKLQIFVQEAPEKNLYHINIYKIAERTGIRRASMLAAFIQGVKEGLFIMEWVYHCPYCGAIAQETLSIYEATHDDDCKSCKVQFNNIIDESIEVFFSVHPKKRIISKIYSKTYYDTIQQIISKGYYLWRSNTTVYGIDVIKNTTYQNLMKDSVLHLDESLEVKHLCIVFTHIHELIQMCGTLGDAKAFELVKEHFRILRAIIEEYDGVLVKTIGDGVMAMFTSCKIALAASLEIQKSLQKFYDDKPDEEKIKIKMGLHSGTALVVTQNDRFDYFGTTVNMAADIQAVAAPNEIAILGGIFTRSDVTSVISDYGVHIKKTKESLKGVQGKSILYRLTL